MKTFLSITVRGKRGVLYEEKCESLSLTNDLGNLDILPDHTNFVSVVSGDIVAKDTQGRTWKQNCSKALVRVTSNVVDVLLFD